MSLSIKIIAVSWVISALLAGCSSNPLSQTSSQIGSQASQLNNQASLSKSSVLTDKLPTSDRIKNAIINDKESINSASHLSYADDDLQDLKVQLAQQQQQLEAMSAEQQILQEQLKRQQLTLTIKPTINANAGRSKQGTASTAYIAFLEEEGQFTQLEELAFKEVSIIPNRDSSLTLTVPQEANFIAIKVGLRYTKKRSQLLIPISSIDFDTPLIINVGACDVTLVEGVNPELAPTFTIKLKHYQQPLVSCL
ncbi:hypothetical protein [uncultured Psychrobacter sp.]|uniref:hypothetical protein n=1 Tax=uncultured Psychrobacter sp. TaxID=259303 RepID=UPI003459F6C3